METVESAGDTINLVLGSGAHLLNSSAEMATSTYYSYTGTTILS
eukprot:SAG31_NODE_5112_length_2735_cov_1.631639_2_plen_44_part_00